MAEIDPSIDLKSPEFMTAIPDLLTVIRDIGRRSEGIRQLVSIHAAFVSLVLI